MPEEPLLPRFSDEECISMLRLARRALEHRLRHGESMSREEMEGLAKGLNTRLALDCFVSLHENGELRGCIGTLTADRPLFEAVASSAVSAGLRDPRFQALTLRELSHCVIEISALSAFHQIGSIDEIEIGRHGLIIESATSRGLLLPQVATRYNWTPREFLRQTYIKAGLPPSDRIASLDKVFVFEARIFSESEYNLP